MKPNKTVDRIERALWNAGRSSEPLVGGPVITGGADWQDGVMAEIRRIGPLEVKHPAALVLHSLGDAGSRGATCSAGVVLATQVEFLRNPAKPETPFLPVASHRASWRRRAKSPGRVYESATVWSWAAAVAACLVIGIGWYAFNDLSADAVLAGLFLDDPAGLTVNMMLVDM
ncbi:MAG: hypothetical protein KJ964_07485 [Verrucomicrobia bacterium]|nr:hypothetical protein [Verrucomicrobiota bacterium]MBU1735498.1 hypothetical protein [Verrucomicrobiota bacterium]MBU1856893.1 hypothetical protein [Verrucomicrobiota bacterium]